MLPCSNEMFRLGVSLTHDSMTVTTRHMWPSAQDRAAPVHSKQHHASKKLGNGTNGSHFGTQLAAWICCSTMRQVEEDDQVSLSWLHEGHLRRPGIPHTKQSPLCTFVVVAAGDLTTGHPPLSTICTVFDGMTPDLPVMRLFGFLRMPQKPTINVSDVA
jgi:hypothetical protein